MFHFTKDTVFYKQNTSFEGHFDIDEHFRKSLLQSPKSHKTHQLVPPASANGEKITRKKLIITYIKILNKNY